MAKRKSKADQAYQSQLFGTNEKQYDWKLATDMHKGSIIVVMNTAVTVSAVRQDNDCVYLAYVEPGTKIKTEQMYNSHDHVYVKL
jgi:hypothetical protein